MAISWQFPPTKMTSIVHLFILTEAGNILLFKRDNGFWGPISGEIERYETPIEAAIREAKEEIGFTIKHVYLTGFLFHCTSPKGKQLCGITCFTFLPDNIDHKSFTFNDEISKVLSVPKGKVLSVLRNLGFPEALSGLEYLMTSHLIERFAAASEKSK